jgi:hypothetical protein
VKGELLREVIFRGFLGLSCLQFMTGGSFGPRMIGDDFHGVKSPLRMFLFPKKRQGVVDPRAFKDFYDALVGANDPSNHE